MGLMRIPFKHVKAPARLQFPYSQRMVIARRDRPRPSGVTLTLLIPPCAPQAPQLHCLLSRSHTRNVLSSARRHRPSPIRRHAHAPDRVAVPLQHAQALARSPDPTPATSCPSSPTPPAAHPASRSRSDPVPLCPSNIRRHCPLSRSHTRNVSSPLPETACRPSGVTLTLLTQYAVCPSERAQALPALQIPHPQRPVPARRHRAPPIRRHAHAHDPIRMPLHRLEGTHLLSRSHTRNVLSQLPDTARRPSGVTLTLNDSIPMPLRACAGIARSPDPTLAASCHIAPRNRPPPVSASAHARLTPLCPSSGAQALPSSRSHTRNVSSQAPRDRPPPVRRHAHALDRERYALRACAGTFPSPDPTLATYCHHFPETATPPVRRHAHAHEQGRMPL